MGDSVSICGLQCPGAKVSRPMEITNLLQFKSGRLEVALTAGEREISENKCADRIKGAFRQWGRRLGKNKGASELPGDAGRGLWACTPRCQWPSTASKNEGTIQGHDRGH